MTQYKKYIFIIISIFLLGVSISTVHATENPYAYHGTDSGFLSLGYAGPSLALAESNVAQVKNPLGGFNNPASIANMNSVYLQSMHSMLTYGAEVFCVNATMPILSNLSMNVNWIQMQISDIPLVSEDEFDLNTDIEADDYSRFLSNGLVTGFAYSVSKELALGLSVSVYQESLDTLSQSGLGIALAPGIYYAVSEQLSVGGYIKNALSYQRWDTGTVEKLEPFLYAGLGYALKPFTVYVQANRGLSAKTRLNTALGLLFEPFDFLNMRLGLYPGDSTQLIHQTNAGITLLINNITLDYTYIGKAESGLYDSSRVMVGVKI